MKRPPSNQSSGKHSSNRDGDGNSGGDGGNSSEAQHSSHHNSTTGNLGDSKHSAVGSSWLFSTSGKSQDLQQQHKRRRYFLVDIPAIPRNVHDSICGEVREEQSVRLVEDEQKLKHLRKKLMDQRAKVEQARNRTEALERSKEEGVNALKLKQQAKHETRIKEMEEELTQKYKARMEKLEKQWEEELEAECMAEVERRSAERKQKADEEEAALQAAEEKKLQEEQQQAKKKSAEAKQQQKDNEDNESDDDDDAEEGEEIEEPEEGEEQEEEVPKRVVLQQEIDQLKAKLEKDNEIKTEMIWLLKEIIKAEEKQNAGMKGNPNARIAASKQA
mmetsp:Transcript_22233/g.52341  ORF Transcript_22233/g.52341 Transcript_22233/m.52341 type:complete len:331 (+) Transcript_22233:57-1049(+)